MCAWVITIAFTVNKWRFSMARISSILSPGSITMASRDCSSPKIEQLHWSTPTGRTSWIISSIVSGLYTLVMDAVLPIAMRWLHIVSVIVVLGGVFYARMVIGEMAMNFRPLAYIAIGGILVSGVYNFMNKGVYPPHYQMW